jgi:hypothetical protein
MRFARAVAKTIAKAKPTPLAEVNHGAREVARPKPTGSA